MRSTAETFFRTSVFGLFCGVAGLLAAAETAERAPSVWDAVCYGAVGDGETDCTAAIQNALNDAGNTGGGTVKLPAGRFAVRGNLSIPRGVTLEGTYHAALTIDRADQKIGGTILLAYAGRGSQEGAAFITLAGSNAVVKGLAVVYPEWSREDLPPVPYPPCIESHDTDNVAVIDCCLLNPYEGIKFVRAGRHFVSNVTGYPIWRGLFVDQCYDIGRVENVHYWPFGLVYSPTDPYCEWVNVNGIAFELARTDWQYMTNLFCFGYGVGYKFSDYGHGGANGNFLGLGADSCRRAVLVEASQMPGLLFTNGEFTGRWTSTDSVCLEVTEKADGKVSLNNCSFWGPNQICIRFDAPYGQLTANACHFCNWDNARKGSPAIRLESGKSIISSNSFIQDGLCISVGNRVQNAILMGNQAPNGFLWEKDTDRPKVVVLGNEEASNHLDDEALSSYRLCFGQSNDLLFAKGLFDRERSGEETFRWSTEVSALKLPVPKNRRVKVKFDTLVPEAALADADQETGIYLNGEKLVFFVEPGRNVYAFEIPPQDDEYVKLDVKVKGWVPETADSRLLGIQYYSVSVSDPEALQDKVFDVNQQEWIGE